MTTTLWENCLNLLEDKLAAQQFNTWIRPLHAVVAESSMKLLAPNHIVKDRVNEQFLSSICDSVKRLTSDEEFLVSIEVGTAQTVTKNKTPGNRTRTNFSRKNDDRNQQPENNIRKDYTFKTFVEGKSNQLARAASIQVGENPGCATYNPLFIYGGVGLGKTHLMHAIGNKIIERKPDARVIYVHSERFVGDMVKAFQHNSIDNFKRHYRSVDALLIDDIQFFANKERSQEEFFHTFNTLLEGQRQIIMTCDRYPKEVGGLEERLKSRFGHGLPVAIEPPDLETRAAILSNKAEQRNISLNDDVVFFIAKRIPSNVRDLEGALNRLQAHARFTNQPITVELTRDALRDLISSQDKQLTIENIQKTASEYFKIKYSELLSKRRTRSIAYPRQVAMALCRELTNHSFPEIGEAFGGRDHTTVLHACRKIAAQRKTDSNAEEDIANLLRILTT